MHDSSGDQSCLILAGRGIIRRAIEDIFAAIEHDAAPQSKFLVRASYLQIYNEVRDARPTAWMFGHHRFASWLKALFVSSCDVLRSTNARPQLSAALHCWWFDPLLRSRKLLPHLQVISDLLKPERTNLGIREDRKRGIYVDGLSEWVVRSPDEVLPPPPVRAHCVPKLHVLNVSK